MRTASSTPECDKCANRDSAYVFNGARYLEKDVCLYDMHAFPAAKHCNKFEPAEAEKAD
jgi:hypothetical protein